MVKKSNKKKKKKSPAKRIFKHIFLTILILILLAGVAFAGITLAIVKTAPPLDVNSILSLNEDSVLFDNKGQFMDNVPTDQKRSIVTLKDMNPKLPKAFISIEDERFEQHSGLDYRRIVGAVIIDVKNKISGKSGLHGASTITQQLLKNTILTNEVSIKRKVQEMYLALQLEDRLSKDQIIEAYLNTIYLGGSANGVEAAAKQYFNKPAKDLNIIECAFIAGITQNPARFYPFSQSAKKDPSPYINRTKTVLQKMNETGNLTNEEYEAALNDINTNAIKFNQPKQNANKLNYEWFSVPAMKQVKKDLKTQLGYSDKEVDRLLTYGGLKIYTTMDRELQEYAKNEVINNITKLTGLGGQKDKSGIIQPQISAVVMDYKSSEVKAIIGGRGDQPPMSFNRAASDNFLKPVGSAIKPLTVYAPFIDMKIGTAATVFEDSPLSSEVSRKYGGYNPNNDDLLFNGYQTLREGLKRSRNLVAVKTENTLGMKNGIAYGEKFGLKFNKDSKTSMAAVALGQFNNNPTDLDGSNPLTIAAAYGTFGNNGLYTAPNMYTKVVDRNGKVILDASPQTKKIISPQASYIMYDMLKGPLTTTGTAAKWGSMPVSGKTGTSHNSQDLWFAGLTPYLSGAVWIGNDSPSKVYGAYSNTAALIWGKIMEKAHNNFEVKEIDRPNGIVEEQICMDSGKLASDLCHKDPRGHRVYTELFIDGTVPTSICDTHVEAKINKNNGKLATSNTPSELIESRIFIRRDYYPGVYLGDQEYVLPSSQDDSQPIQTPKPPDQATPNNNNNNSIDPNNNTTTPNNSDSNNEASNKKKDTDNKKKEANEE